VQSAPPSPTPAFGKILRILALAALVCGAVAGPAMAVTISNPVATFSGLDKITARITNFDVYINETVQFGALQITPRVCYTRPPNETQRTSVFVEVDQVSLQGGVKRIFTGWMFADSPALNAVDNAVYDIWLTGCKQSSDVPPPAKLNPPPAAQPAPSDGPVLIPETPSEPPPPADIQALPPPDNTAPTNAPAQ